VLKLLEDQPGIALELQAALALSIREANRTGERMRHKEQKVNFYNHVKGRFQKKEDKLLREKKLPFSKMIVDLARKAKEAKKPMRHLSKQISFRDKQQLGADGNLIQIKGRKLSFGILSKSSRLFRNGSEIDNPSVKENSEKPKITTFFQGMVDLDPTTRSAKQLLVEKLQKLDKLHAKALSFIDENGHEERKIGTFEGREHTTQGSSVVTGTDEEDPVPQRKQLKQMLRELLEYLPPRSGHSCIHPLISPMVSPGKKYKVPVSKKPASPVAKLKKSKSFDHLIHAERKASVPSLKILPRRESLYDIATSLKSEDSFGKQDRLQFRRNSFSKKPLSLPKPAVDRKQRRQSFPSLDGEKFRLFILKNQIV
jgi:hypothetical protein